MLVGLNCESRAAAQTAALEHITTIGRGHALSETVYTHAAADLGLVCSLGHSNLLPYSVKDDCTYPQLWGLSPIGVGMLGLDWRSIIPR